MTGVPRSHGLELGGSLFAASLLHPLGEDFPLLPRGGLAEGAPPPQHSKALPQTHGW